VRIDASLVERLLYEPESNELDFKRDQYQFIGAEDDKKSELLKDILAFGNSWRRSDAFILIGVEEVKGGKGKLTGLGPDDLDDAKIQQFVNSKTQRPVSFSYQVLELDQRLVGVIHIPLQSRPLYLRKDFGKLRKGVVYVRRGSATDEADPHEISRMGSDAVLTTGAEPKLSVDLGDAQRGTLSGGALSVVVLNLEIPEEEIPDYSEASKPFSLDYLSTVNPNFFRELVEYVQVTERVQGFNVAVENNGDVVAHGVRVIFETEDSTGKIIFRRKKPAYPEAKRFAYPVQHLSMPHMRVPEMEIERVGTTWRIEVPIGKVQAKDRVWYRSKLYIGAHEGVSFALRARIFADNLSSPVEGELKLDVASTTQKVDLATVLAIEEKRLSATYQQG
jgi:hypothetical protein